MLKGNLCSNSRRNQKLYPQTNHFCREATLRARANPRRGPNALKTPPPPCARLLKSGASPLRSEQVRACADDSPDRIERESSRGVGAKSVHVACSKGIWEGEGQPSPMNSPKDIVELTSCPHPLAEAKELVQKGPRKQEPPVKPPMLSKGN